MQIRTKSSHALIKKKWTELTKRLSRKWKHYIPFAHVWTERDTKRGQRLFYCINNNTVYTYTDQVHIAIIVWLSDLASLKLCIGLSLGWYFSEWIHKKTLSGSCNCGHQQLLSLATGRRFQWLKTIRSATFLGRNLFIVMCWKLVWSLLVMGRRALVDWWCLIVKVFINKYYSRKYQPTPHADYFIINTSNLLKIKFICCIVLQNII